MSVIATHSYSCDMLSNAFVKSSKHMHNGCWCSLSFCISMLRFMSFLLPNTNSREVDRDWKRRRETTAFLRIFRPYTKNMDYRNRSRNLRTSRAPLKSQANQGTSLFTSAATNQSVFQRVVNGGLRSDFQRVRGDRVGVKVGV